MNAKEKATMWLRGEIDCDVRQLVRDLVDAAAIAALGGVAVPEGWTVRHAVESPYMPKAITVDSEGTSTLVDENNNLYAFFAAFLPAPPSKEG